MGKAELIDLLANERRCREQRYLIQTIRNQLIYVLALQLDDPRLPAALSRAQCRSGQEALDGWIENALLSGNLDPNIDSVEQMAEMLTRVFEGHEC